MPGRAWEVIEMRHSNTAYGGVRNIMIDRGMVCFVTLYHKNYRSSEQVKVIHRYLPREAGELVVWYLWLVLPFWQQVQGIVKGADEPSAFLWAEEIVKKEEAQEGEANGISVEGEEGEEGEEDEEAAKEEGQAAWVRERKWTPDRMRRVMQQHSERHLQARVGISAWRHIAIAISNRYLNKAFGQGRDEGDEYDEDDEGALDSIWDLQAGHSSHVAGMVYARELQQGAFGTAERRDKFRVISRQWHRFLGFQGEDSYRVGAIRRKRKADVFESVREEARFRRFARLRQVDIAGRLKQMVGPDAQFRGIQEPVIRAIIRGASPIIQVTGTGGGKSMSFMLPAFCSPDGVTVVVVPLVALREDLQARCQKSGIDSHIWQSRECNRAASIVFVTPESAVTKAFHMFVNRQQARGQLDRIVVDECHTILDSERAFRPQMQALGGVLREMGVQGVFLTATLPLGDEEEFCKRMKLDRRLVCSFRARTTRANVGYRIRRVDGGEEGAVEEEICRVVGRGLDGEGKIIVYSRVIEQAERLAEALSCPVYHSKVDTMEGKARRMKEWVEKTRVIVATNALGLGIDIPDVRLVVHAGAPRQLRDYAQESGRAGRDGKVSEAVIIQSGIGAGLDDSMQEFIEGNTCRRVVLDRVMDGWEERAGCEEGEALCDMCGGGQGLTLGEDESEADNMGEGDWVRVEDEEEVVREFVQSQDRAAQARQQGRTERRQEAEEVEAFQQQLESWTGCCLICRAAEEEAQYHERDECPKMENNEWDDVERGVTIIEQEMFKKRRFEKYSGCFYCGIPQALCDRWEAREEDGGQFKEVRRGRCQWKGVLVRIFVGLMVKDVNKATRIILEMMEKDGYDGTDRNTWYTWFGRRIQWSGVESN